MNKSIYSKESKLLIEKLKKARKEARIDQKKAAKLLGVSQSYISKAETGQLRIDVFQLKKFANIYGKNIDYFLK
jgi:transcriptional regulator with XRE-family HTH domain